MTRLTRKIIFNETIVSKQDIQAIVYEDDTKCDPYLDKDGINIKLPVMTVHVFTLIYIYY